MSATLAEAIAALQAAETAFEDAADAAIDLLNNPPSEGATPQQIAAIDSVTTALQTATNTLTTALNG